MEDEDIKCKECPSARHGFDRNASHNSGRYVCECESFVCPSEQLRQRVAELTAEHDEYKGKLEDEIVDHDCHRAELTAWATKYREAITERDALKQQHDELLKALETIAGANAGNTSTTPLIHIAKGAIASVKEKA